MSDLVPATDIERIVGAPRHATDHIARAVAHERKVYILHSGACIATANDLRRCPFSLALDNGIKLTEWIEDVPLIVEIVGDKLTPRNEGGTS